MSEPFIAEIRIFAGNFAPRGWANCDGQLLPIAQNTALFSLVGTLYGGDGETNFGLPNLKGRSPMHAGNGPGLSPRSIGQSGGSADVTLNGQQIPQHQHALNVSGEPAVGSSPVGNLPASTREDSYAAGGTQVGMHGSAVLPSGGGGSHNNLQPYLVLRFIIALVGIYPSQS